MSSIYTDHKPAGGGAGLFLKITDGESVKLRVASEPAIFSQTFEGQAPTTRYAWVVWNRNEKKAQVFNGGVSIFNQIADLFPEWGDPQEFDITIKRTGTALETRYSVNPSPKSIDLTEEEKAECEKIDLPKAVKGNWLKDFEKNGQKFDGVDEVYEDDAALAEIFPE